MNNLNLDELKDEYNERRENIRIEKSKLTDKLAEILSQLKKNAVDMREIVEAYPIFKGNTWTEEDEAKLDFFLKTFGLKCLSDFDLKWAELSLRYEELTKSSQVTMSHIGKLLAEEKEEFLLCPNCNGVSYTTSKKEFVESDTGRIPLVHTEKCILCNGRGRIPVRELCMVNSAVTATIG